jgi:hypothetical protein
MSSSAFVHALLSDAAASRQLCNRTLARQDRTAAVSAHILPRTFMHLLTRCSAYPPACTLLTPHCISLLLLSLLHRLLKAFDLINLCNNIFTYSMLLRTFGFGSSSGMSWHHLLPVATYFILAILQLLVLLLAPNLHQVIACTFSTAAELACTACI